RGARRRSAAPAGGAVRGDRARRAAGRGRLGGLAGDAHARPGARRARGAARARAPSGRGSRRAAAARRTGARPSGAEEGTLKSWLAVAGPGVGLFTVTAVGTLALRGRLGGDAADRVPFVANLLDGEAPAGVPEEAALRDPVAGPPMPLAETAPETPEAAAEARSAVPTVFRFEGLLPDLSEDELDRMVDELLAARSEVEDQRAALRTEWDAYQSRLAD